MKLARTPVYLNIAGRYVLDFLKFKILRSSDNPSLVVRLAHADMGHEGRWLYLLLYFLAHKQSKIVLMRDIWNLKEYYRLGKYGRLIFGIKNLSFLKKVPKPDNNTILISDFPYPETERKKWKKFIYVDYNLEKSRAELVGKNYVVLNPRMHPFSYANYSFADFDFFRKSEKKIRIFFSGNVSKKAYLENLLTQKFNIVPRYTLIQSLNNLLGDNLKQIMNIDEFDEVIEIKCKNKFILDDKRFLSNDKWLSTLASSFFFLCPPASHMPFSHNTIEAMAVGTIPLINYQDWFGPPLSDGINCVTFNDAKDLALKIKQILSMNENKIAEMRKNVLEYYKKYLSVESFYKSIYESPHQELTLFYNVEDVSMLPKITKDSVIFGNSTE